MWKSKDQSVVTVCTAEAEYMVPGSLPIKRLCYDRLISFVTDMERDFQIPLMVACQATIKIARNDGSGIGQGILT